MTKRVLRKQVSEKMKIYFMGVFGYTGALKAPVRCFGNHLSEKRKSLFQTDN